MATKEKPTPEFVARHRVPDHFAGASTKTLANLNSKGLGPKPYKGEDGRIIFYEYGDLVKHYTGGKK